MQNQAPLSPARILYQELRDNEAAGLLDTRPTRHSSVTGHGDMDRITNKVEQINPVDGIADDDAMQPRSALAAIIRLQSSEIERLALENDRFAARLDAVNRLLEEEQNRRRTLDRQRHETSLRNEPPATAFDVEEIRRAAREGMSAEIKPVLMAILDLLESTLPRDTEAAKPTALVGAAVVGAAVVAAPASLVEEVMDEFRQLPEILTRPIEELTSGPGNAGSAPDRIADRPARVPPRQPRPARHEAQPSAMPGVFAWTNLFF